MSKSLKQVLEQIAQLEKQADALRNERTGVVNRIREAIAHYGLTTEELFSPAGKRRAATTRRAGAAKPGRKAKTAGTPKYSDGAGRTWTGVGKRPNWFKEAMASGKTEAELLIKK